VHARGVSACYSYNNDSATSMRYGVESAWLFFGDVWGFSDLMRRQPAEALQSLEKTADVVRRLSARHRSVRYLMFSDFILCARLLDDAAPDRQRDGLQALTDLSTAVEYLISKFLEVGLLLRGCIIFGSLHWQKKIVFGEALLEAADFEKSAVAPPLVFLPVSALLRAKKAGCLPRAAVEENIAGSVFVTTKDGGLLRAVPLVGDDLNLLEQRLESTVRDLTLSLNPAPRPAAAVHAATEIIQKLKSRNRASP
jgi:hypothetical protein